MLWLLFVKKDLCPFHFGWLALRSAKRKKVSRCGGVRSLNSDNEPDVQDKEGGSYPETGKGFFLWLVEKEIRQSKVREISQKSYNGKHLSSEQVRSFVDDQAEQQVAEWLDEGKNQFRLINMKPPASEAWPQEKPGHYGNNPINSPRFSPRQPLLVSRLLVNDFTLLCQNR